MNKYMKICLVLAWLSCTATIPMMSQNNNSAAIRLFVGGCTFPEYRTQAKDTVVVYKLPEEKMVYKGVPSNFPSYRPVVINNLPLSEYSISYKNTFKQECLKKINVATVDTYTVMVCLDELTSYPQNSLAKMYHGDTLSMIAYISGCFVSEGMKLVIVKNHDSYLAELYDIKHTYNSKKKDYYYTEIYKYKTFTMQDSQIEAFVKLENVLNYSKSNCSTNSVRYIINSKVLTIDKLDGLCNRDWSGGYSYLRYCVFGDETMRPL